VVYNQEVEVREASKEELRLPILEVEAAVMMP